MSSLPCCLCFRLLSKSCSLSSVLFGLWSWGITPDHPRSLDPNSPGSSNQLRNRLANEQTFTLCIMHKICSSKYLLKTFLFYESFWKSICFYCLIFFYLFIVNICLFIFIHLTNYAYRTLPELMEVYKIQKEIIIKKKITTKSAKI